jgi:AbrB family looped-hinge helix DNA binding protein
VKFLGSAKISSKNMITIPKDARKKLKIEPGGHVLFYLKDDEVVIKKG